MAGGRGEPAGASPEAPPAASWQCAPTPEDEDRRLKLLLALRVLDTERDPVLDGVVRTCADAFGVPISLVSLVDEHRQWFKARVGLGAAETSRDVSFCGWAVVERDSVFVVENALEDERFAGNPLVTGPPNIRFYSGATLTDPCTGLSLGTLCVIDTKPRKPTAEQFRLLKNLAQVVTSQLLAHIRNERLSMAALDSLGGGFLLLERSDDLTVLAANKEWGRITGRTQADSQGARLLDLLQGGEGTDPAADRHERLLAAVTEPSGTEIDVCCTSAQGDPLWLSLRLTHIDVSDQGDEARPCILCSVVDVTPQMQAKQRSREIIDAKNNFLANVSHELRTPMNAILACTDLLKNVVTNSTTVARAETDDMHELIDMLNRSGEQMLALVDQVLDFAKIDNDMMHLHIAPFKLDECLDLCCEMVGLRAISRRVLLTCVVDPDLPETVVGDDVRVRQIIINLLTNAAKFTPEGGEVELTVTADPETAELGPDRIMLRFVVRDTGLGIAQDSIPKLFKAFSRVDDTKTRETEGTGLGLTICARLVDQMGGRIDLLETEVGTGSSFGFTLNLGRGQSRAVCESGVNLWTVSDVAAFNRTVVSLGTRANLGVTVKTPAELHEALKDGFAAGAPDGVVVDKESIAADVRRMIAEREKSAPTFLIYTFDSPCQVKPHTRETIKPPTQRTLSANCASLNRRASTSASPPASRLARSDAPGKAMELPLSAIRIFIADDNTINRKVLTRMLTSVGVEVCGDANDGEEACLRLLQMPRVDLVVMDIQMPKMDGLQATKRLRAELSPDRQPFILAFTADVVGDIVKQCQAAGMNGFLAKPANRDRLQQSLLCVRDWLESGRNAEDVLPDGRFGWSGQ